MATHDIVTDSFLLRSEEGCLTNTLKFLLELLGTLVMHKYMDFTGLIPDS